MSISSSSVQVIRFGVFEANLRSRELRKSGIKIKLHEQPFQVLALLLGRPGEVITREELRQKLWPADTFVDFDHSLNNAVNRLREALGDSADSPRFIETIPRRGYRFVGETYPTDSLEVGEGSTARSENKNAEPMNATRSTERTAYHWVLGAGLVVAAVKSQVWVYPMRGGGQPFRLLAGEAREGEAQFSPDGRWVAYTSNESGRDEIYVVPFRSMTSGQSHSAALDGKWKLSTAGGRAPRWRLNGTELFYLASDNTVMAVPVSKQSATFTYESARPLFRANPGFYNISYDVSPDGNKFIVNTAPEERTAPITIVENWLSDLKR